MTMEQRSKLIGEAGRVYPNSEKFPEAEEGIEDCPWCGSSAGIGWSFSMKAYYIICLNTRDCHVKPQTHYHNDKQILVDYWNKCGN